MCSPNSAYVDLDSKAEDVNTAKKAFMVILVNVKLKVQKNVYIYSIEIVRILLPTSVKFLAENFKNSYRILFIFSKKANGFFKNSLDAGIQDRSTSISIVVKFEQPLLEEMVMKVTNVYKQEIVDTRA